MRVLVIGSDGFVGSSVASVLANSHKVFHASRKSSSNKDQVQIDLLDIQKIVDALAKVRPDAVINCAGILENNDTAEQNFLFTKNLINAIVASRINPRRIIISGSSAEYGMVNIEDLPVDENVKTAAASSYGLSKLRETSFALEAAQEHNLSVVIARIFNPIGIGMRDRFVLPSIMQQVRHYRLGETDHIEVSRLDAKRDFINVKDVATAIKSLLEGFPKEKVYNIGSGRATSNEELIRIVLKHSELTNVPKIVETSALAEPLVANQADITRISSEFNWHPKYTIEETVKEIIYDKENQG